MPSGQPALHDLITVVRAPDQVLSASDGQVRLQGPQGWYCRDRRALARLELEIAGRDVDTVGVHRDGASAVWIHGAIRSGAGDPTIAVSRHRAVSPAALTERVTLTNYGAAAALTVRAHVGTDLAALDAVRSGRPARPVQPLWHDGMPRWEADDVTVSLQCDPPPAGPELTWNVDIPSGSSWSVTLSASCTLTSSGGFTQSAPVDRPQWTESDLAALVLADPLAPTDHYVAAGAPWYLTLFGRDALWTARMLLPLSLELAAGTLRTLARRQGTRHDAGSEEAPGKILHEARPAPVLINTVSLPAVYYGTIDATPLWVCLLHEAWQSGLPEAEVAALLPHLTAAMSWITGPDADPDGDGLLEYAGSPSGGLTNQGWKDSDDALRNLDGSFARAPVALCEVQGYAYAAALGAASLAGAFDLPDGPAWLSWAARLRERFQASYWLTDEVGPYPAIALDADKRPVTGATSNMGHLLGTGLLSAEEAALVATRLAAPDLTTPYGLRTMTSANAAFNPLSYHCGSIWPHDTAIAILGLMSEGHTELAAELATGLMLANEHFDGRVPELYGVFPDGGPPVHYPTSCRPQAWAAAGIFVASRHL